MVGAAHRPLRVPPPALVGAGLGGHGGADDGPEQRARGFKLADGRGDAVVLAQADRTPVTVLGMGPMGRALAGAFIDSGHPTTVWNRSAARAQPVVAKGAAPAPSAAEAAQASPLVVVCVLDDRAALAVLDSAGDALKGRTVVNLTTDSPERAREVAAWAEQRGVDYLDGSIMTPTTTIGGPAAQVLYSGPQRSMRGTARHWPTSAGPPCTWGPTRDAPRRSTWPCWTCSGPP